MKKILSIAIVVVLLLSLSCSALAANKPTRLTIGLVNAVDHPFTLAAYRLAEELEAATNGELTLEVFPANQLGGEAEITTGLVEGSIDMCVNANGELSKRVPGYGITDAPYLFKDAEAMLQAVKGEAFQALHEELITKGIRVISPWYLGTRHITTTNKIIEHPADLDGFKIRVPDQQPALHCFLCLGCNPTPVDFSELYMALQQNVCDGEENSFGQIIGNKLYEVQKYVILSGHQVQNLWLTISEKTWEKLTPEQQDIFVELGTKIGEEVSQEMMELEKGEQLEFLKSEGLEIIEVDQSEFRDFAVANMEKDGFFDLDLYKAIQADQA